MIPIMKQEAPNILPRYICGKCGAGLPHFSEKEIAFRWKFCCMCGEEIEWEKAKPVVWKEMKCSVCGKLLVRLDERGHPYSVNYFREKDLCYTCLRPIA